ncbi:MAG TPA: DUF4124 domain-containing protein [Desulfuromonadaceae bacterium]
MKTLIIMVMVLLAATVAHAGTYQWTDKEGTVHFSESLGEVPAQYRNSARAIGTGSGGAADKGVSTPAPPQRADDYGSVAPQVEELKERMLNDEGIMALIRALQSDPDMQALLSDPAILRAVQAMDMGTLMNNPKFMKLFTNPRIREIEKRVLQGGAP